MNVGHLICSTARATNLLIVFGRKLNERVPVDVLKSRAQL
jgi:hypothetical protein